MADSDVKTGEEILERRLILSPGDPVFDPRFRPSLETVIPWLLSYRNTWLVPYASVAFDHHRGVEEQNLFRCLFGRDSLIIADFLGSRVPGLRRGVICALADYQGKAFDAMSEEEPGRIPHEVRDENDDRAIEISAREGWKFPYYGSVDSTLLWLKALAKESQEDPGILDVSIKDKTLAERAVLAVEWILNRLQTPTGLIESHRSNIHGIKNQVWKDSGDSYMHADGKIAGDSIASIETCGQTYDALQGALQIQILRPYLGWPLSSKEMHEIADSVRSKLIELMWLGDRFAMGTERVASGKQIPLDSQASNQGQLLDSSIFDGPEWIQYSRAIAEAITDPQLLGPAGLRTLSRNHPSYRPGGYHTGSAWPMDGMFAGRGLLRHGFTQHATSLIGATVSAIESIGGFPELLRSDAPLYGWVTSEVIDIKGAADGFGIGFNRVCQPPQMIQGWTVAAYAWAQDHRHSWCRW
jgi:glycogen debranching enzyme